MASNQAGIDPKKTVLQRVPIEPFFIGLGVLALLLLIAGDTGRETLAYDRAAIESGQWWRFFSGHLVHMNWQHGLLNVVALLAVGGIAGRSLDSRGWLLVSAMCAIGVSAGLWVMTPAVAWYVGLSGVLHGLLAAYAVSQLRASPLFATIILSGIALKLAYEQMLIAPLPGLGLLSNGPVVVDAHLFGAVSGLIAAFANHIRVQQRTWL